MARSLNGSTDRIAFAAVPQMGTGTIAAWIKPSSFPASGTARCVWTYYQETESETFNTQDKNLWINSNGTITARIYIGADRTATSSGALTSGAWNHVGMTFDATSIIVYLNGTGTSATGGTSYTGYGNPAFSVAGLFVINGVNEDSFVGDIADLGIIVGTILTAAEMTMLAQGHPLSRLRYAKNCYAPLWGTSSPEADLSGNAVTGALTGTAKADHPPLMRYWGPPRTHHISAAPPASTQPPRSMHQFRLRRAG